MRESEGYSGLQIGLHWIVAVLVAAQYIFNAPIADAWDAITPGQTPEGGAPVVAHVAAGVAIALLVLWRIALLLRRGAPAAPANGPARLKLLAKAVHGSFHAVLLIMVISGGLAWFGGVQAAASVHSAFRVVLLALIGLHVLAIPFHRLVLGNDVMARMLRAAKG